MKTGVQRTQIFGFEITSADTVVDVGSGPGNECAIAGQIGAEVIALDIDTHELHQLTERMRSIPARSFCAIQCNCNTQRIPLPDGTASVVIAKEVMEHLENPPQFLAELNRIGRAGARYLITVPDPASEALMRIVAPDYYWKTPCHLHVFEHDQLRELIRAAGLEIEKCTSVGFYDSMWWCFRMAIGTDYYPGHTGYTAPPPILADWENVWKALEASARGAQVALMLDQLIPKSQIVSARKPVRTRFWKRWSLGMPKNERKRCPNEFPSTVPYSFKRDTTLADESS